MIEVKKRKRSRDNNRMQREHVERIRRLLATRRYTMKAIARDIDVQVERLYDFVSGRVIRPRGSMLERLDEWLKNPGGYDAGQIRKDD